MYKRIKIELLEANAGQIKGLPRNPRKWSDEDLQDLADSLRETPELYDARPLLIFPHGERFVVLGGNMRLAASMLNGDTDAPCWIYPEDTPVEKLKEIVSKDNASFGAWDTELWAKDWDWVPKKWHLPDFGPVDGGGASSGVPAGGLSTQGREGGQEYKEFVDKFNQEQPLTTDDCYTPAEVYEIVKRFVDEKITPLEGRKIVRPFYPGGDYEKADYPEGCIVLDNPPFSIYSKIVRFYAERKIPFFLFAPGLTLLVSDVDVTFIVAAANIRYENGAMVRTGFVTNLCPGLRVWVEPTLRRQIEEAQHTEATSTVYEFPAEVVTGATLMKIAAGEELKIQATECRYISDLDKMKEDGRGLYGGGLLLSRAAAEKARAAAEKARAAAEKARAVKIELSAREKKIVKELNKSDQTTTK